MDIPTDLKAAVMARIDNGAAGAVWTPADFLDLHGRDAEVAGLVWTGIGNG